MHESFALSFEADDDDPEGTERTIVSPPGFPYMELRTLGEILEAEGIFIPGYRPPPVGLCDPDGFAFEAEFEGIKTILLPDRNVVSRMAKITSGVLMDDMLRKVAAIKAFCYCLDIDIEPSIAFHELAHTQGNDVANIELARFRDADNADPLPWIDLAVGKSDSLPPVAHKRSPEARDLAFPLRRWRRNYIATLKIAELELAKRPNLDRMLALLSWMRDDFIIAGPAALLACIYFAPNSPPRKGLFKHLHSPNRDRAIQGVRNAAWDLTHMSDMVKAVSEETENQRRYIFASFDEGLRMLARLSFGFALGTLTEAPLAKALVPYWNIDHAEQIAKAIAELFSQINDEDRRQRRAQSPLAIDDMIQYGEEILSSFTI